MHTWEGGIGGGEGANSGCDINLLEGKNVLLKSQQQKTFTNYIKT